MCMAGIPDRKVRLNERASAVGAARTDPDQVTARQITYDLRRLKTHGLIVRIEHTHRYRVTDDSLHTAAFNIRIHDRMLPTGLADLADPHANRPLRAAAIAYQKAIDNSLPQPESPADPRLESEFRLRRPWPFGWPS